MQRENIKREKRKTRSVREDWSAWLPEEMDQLFDATRSDLETSNFSLSVALDEAHALCEQKQSTPAQERAIAIYELFNRLAIRVRAVIRTMEEHASHSETFPNVTALRPANFRGSTARRISFMDSLLGKVVISGRARFFLKLHALNEIIEELQTESRIAAGLSSTHISKRGTFDEPSRDVSDSHRDPSYLGPMREASETASGLSLSRFLWEISESPKMKFGTAWCSFGMLVVPLAALVAGGMSERVALSILLGAIFPLQYVIFFANNKIGAASRRSVPSDEEKSHGESFAKEMFEFDHAPILSDRVWKELEVLGYDLNTSMAETTVMLKSYFCALRPEGYPIESFRRNLRASRIDPPIGLLSAAERQGYSSKRVRKMQYLTPEDIASIK
jgi:hypothetical protein